MTLFLIGGGPSTVPAAALDGFVEQVRQRGPRIAIAFLGAADETAHHVDGYVDPILARMPDAIIEHVRLDADEVDWPDNPEELAGLVVAGGWTPGYLDALIPHRELISKLVRGGMPYLGYSAGAMIVAKHAIAGGWRHQGRQIVPETASEGLDELEIRDGLSLIAPSVDVHADTNSTLGRAIATLQAGVMNSVVAIDESAAMVIDALNGRVRVLGEGRIAWVTRVGGDFDVRFEQAQP